jgi:tRNA(adenine34) deaminase
MTSSENFMQMALDQAQKAFDQGETPIGCVIVENNHIIATAFNTREQDKSPLAHAEIKALLLATQTKDNWRLTDATVYVTLEPCPMCLGAILQARVKNLVFGCTDEKRQITTDTIFPSLKNKAKLTDNNHTLTITGGILAKETSQLIQDFFKKRRSVRDLP